MSVYLPGDQSWYDMKTGAAYKGGATHKLEASEERIPSFQRAGTIIPRKDRFRRSSTQMEHDPYTLVCLINLVDPSCDVIWKCRTLSLSPTHPRACGHMCGYSPH